MNNNLIIREMLASEYENLIDIWIKSSLPFKPEGRDSEENIKRQLKLKNNRFFVAEINERFAGAIIASHNGRKGWINRLAVLPEFRGKGIAASLIKKSEDFFLSSNVKIFACLIEDWNETSMIFFHNKDYVKHKDIIYYTKKLNPDI
ncbi:MAG: GNAT family N-acetyltransferase [Candidatus Tenebribacter burtonii]|jgi:predicted GNAT family acetyltransferase|nr:GNAT family N-acetyltransferase [Candidatus Tenebribacter burtonii]